MYVTALLLVAGKGRRFKSKVPKPLFEINGRPIFIYALTVLNRHPYVHDIIIVANRNNIKEVIRNVAQYRMHKVRRIILGGKRRQDSVYSGLKAIASRTGLVLIHDGVRPFIDPDTISLLIKGAKRDGAAILGVPVKATIKKIKNKKLKIKNRISLSVQETIDRHNLWEIQTPQVFKRDLILRAYKKFGKMDATDDAMLVEKLGAQVGIVLGSGQNIKITTPEDLAIAQSIAKTFRL